MTPPPEFKRKSAIWRLIYVCASMRLAMVELFVIALACALATVCESRFDAEVAQTWFYNAPWFFFWLGLVCMNLVCATLVRLPWRRKDVGFILTHYGVILLLTGGLVGQKFGFATDLRLHGSTTSRETQMVFAKYGAVVLNRSGNPGACRISLSMDDPEPKMILERAPMGCVKLGLFSILGKSVLLKGDTTQIFVKNYWPDFVMGTVGPSSKSDQPNNPAILVELTRPCPPPVAVCVRPFAFQVQLLRFEVPRDEGTAAPSDFRSTVRFFDPSSGETLDTVISMNKPAFFPAGFLNAALGRNCKFSQAQWNPDDLEEATFHVTHDPGWPFKWLGSLMFCLGMVRMIVK